PGTLCYGFPRMPRGVKASIMHDGASVSDPRNVVRTVGDTEVDALRIALRPILPSLADARVRETAVCLFTNTPDHDFLIDFHPRNPRVLISSPCSGHGFKFASAIGELQADLLIDGTTRFDLSPFSLSRWSDARVGSARSPAS
ncbi:MAG: FAD-dependent oxidoreductase, partial [Gemmatimonadaceae bacterium]